MKKYNIRGPKKISIGNIKNMDLEQSSILHNSVQDKVNRNLCKLRMGGIEHEDKDIIIYELMLDGKKFASIVIDKQILLD